MFSKPVVAVALVLSVALLPAAVPAATITVNSTVDDTNAGDGHCTLREAIANVNASADTSSGDCTAGTGSGDTITFALPVPARINLRLGELEIQQDVAIAGPMGGSLVVRAHRNRVFKITAGTTSISELVIASGNARLDMDPVSNGWGGGIYNASTMTLTDCTVTRNGAFRGGGIYNAGTMTLTNCTVSHNSAFSGGGIFNVAGAMSLADSTLDHNVARRGVAGIFNQGGTMTLTNCTLSGNKMLSSFASSILNFGSSSMTLTNCTVAAGRASGGDAVDNDSGSTLTLLNTVIADNSDANCGGSVVSQGHNLDSDGTCFTTGGTDLVDTDPLLARLANYGGTTNTMALCAGVGMPSGRCRGRSPAIDAGDDAVVGPPYNLTTDQRGQPRKAGAHVDIGAYEAQ